MAFIINITAPRATVRISANCLIVRTQTNTFSTTNNDVLIRPKKFATLESAILLPGPLHDATRSGWKSKIAFNVQSIDNDVSHVLKKSKIAIEIEEADHRAKKAVVVQQKKAEFVAGKQKSGGVAKGIKKSKIALEIEKVDKREKQARIAKEEAAKAEEEGAKAVEGKEEVKVKEFVPMAMGKLGACGRCKVCKCGRELAGL